MAGLFSRVKICSLQLMLLVEAVLTLITIGQFQMEQLSAVKELHQLLFQQPAIWQVKTSQQRLKLLVQVAQVV